jgi:hypothetical protein
MSNSKLKAELKKRVLSPNGNKSVLTKRLLNNMEKPVVREEEPEKGP